MKKFNYKNTYFIYTVTFLLLLPFIFLPFLIEGRSFVWKVDGFYQHFPILGYYGKLLRNILSGHGFAMVDFKLGLGFDTITTLNYYALGDPLSLLTVFMTKQNAVFFYDFLILIRFYLAGISYILLMKYWKKDGAATALGALIYIFTGFTLYTCLRHPFFMNPLIYLPLFIIGVEQVLRRKKPYLMIGMVFISAISNFYFFFILSVITVIFIVYRYFTEYRKFYQNILTGFLITGLRTGGYYLLGLMLSAFIFIPVIYAFTQNGRLNIGPELLTGYFAYGQKYYITLFQSMYTTGVYAGYWTILSYCLVVIVSFSIVICNKKYWKLQIAYVLIFLGLFIPAFGYFMNGFSYVTNRWVFLLGFLIAVTFRLTYEKIFQLQLKEMIALLVELIAYGILAFVFPSRDAVKQIFFYLLVVVIILLFLQVKWIKERRKLASGILYALVVITLGINGYFLYSSENSNYVSQFLKGKTIDKNSYGGALSMIPDIKDSSFYRVDTFGDLTMNKSMNVGYYGVGAYFSLMDGKVTSYLKDLEDLSQITAYRFSNLGNRTILDSLASVKYFVTTSPATVPFGYKKLKEVHSGIKTYYLYQNEYALPLGYAYGNYMLKEDYDKLSSLEKQSVMMNSVILEEDSTYADKIKDDTDYGITRLDTKITGDSGITLKDHLIQVNKNRAAVTLSFHGLPNSEIYVRIKNLTINKKKGITYSFYANIDNGAKKKINVRNKYYNSYFGKDNYLLNAGQNLDGNQNIVLTFPRKQTLSFDSIEVYSVDMKYYQSRVKSLFDNTLTNIKLSNNLVQGDITMNRKGILMFGIPYSSGWRAKVDGKETKLIAGNVMYMALPLESGKHRIVLSYETPYLKAGCLISVFAIFVLAGVIIYRRITLRRHHLSNI